MKAGELALLFNQPLYVSARTPVVAPIAPVAQEPSASSPAALTPTEIAASQPMLDFGVVVFTAGGKLSAGDGLLLGKILSAIDRELSASTKWVSGDHWPSEASAKTLLVFGGDPGDSFPDLPIKLNRIVSTPEGRILWTSPLAQLHDDLAAKRSLWEALKSLKA